MSQPPAPFERSYSFTDFSTSNPNAQQPGQKIDQELNNAQTAINDTQDRLGEIQSDDGKVRNSALRLDTLGSELSPYLSASAISAINAAGSTQVTTVNTAGSTQVGVVNAAGATNLASLNAVINSTAAQQAINAAADANTSYSQAAMARDTAVAASISASNANVAAVNAASVSSNAANVANGYAVNALASAEASQSAINSTQSLLTSAQTAASLADWNRDQASQYAAQAAQSAENAAASAANAVEVAVGSVTPYVTEAQNYATASAGSAVASASSASAAAGSASSAYNASLSAGSSASAAAGSATNASASAAAAAVSAGSITPFTGGPVTTAISLVSGVYHTWFDVGEIYGYNTADNSFFDAYPNYIAAGDGTDYVTLSTAGVRFADGTVQSTAATGGGSGSYLPLAGGTMTGNITFDGTSGQFIGKGQFDTSRGGNYGISLVCSIGYEFNWQAGWLTTTNQGSPTPRPLYLDSLAGTTLRSWDSATDTGTEVSHTGITFQDSTTQNTAAYVVGSGDLDMMGNNITNGNFSSPAGQVSAQNVTMSSGGVLTFGDNTVQTTAYTGGGSGIPEAPQDNYVYGRMNANWVRVPGVAAYSQIATGVNSISGWSATGGNVYRGSTGSVVADIPASITALICVGNSGAVLDISGCSSITSLTANYWPNVGTMPSTISSVNFTSCTFTTPPSVTIGSLSFYGLQYCDVTTAPSLDYATSMTTVIVANNVSMATTPTFAGCSALIEVVINNNTSMTTAPNLSACVVGYINISGNTSMTTYPIFSGSTIDYVDASNCAISDCNSFGANIYSNAASNGHYEGYLNISGGTNESFDSTALPSWIGDLQSMSWTVVYNSY